MRFFIAIEFNENIKEIISNVQREVLEISDDGNFSRKENIHLTLYFIGQANDNMIEGLKDIIDSSINNFKSFSLNLDRLGFFSKKNKKILWIGVKGELNLLYNLHMILEQKLKEKGFPIEERPYTPHITIARQVSLKENIKELTKIDIPYERIEVRGISLMKSTREKGMLTYIPVYRGDFIG